jgi:hypothetical protein
MSPMFAYWLALASLTVAVIVAIVACKEVL